METYTVVVPSVILGLGVITNALLLASLIVTWSYCRQVKWYLAALSASNWLQLAFTLVPFLAVTVDSTFRGSDALCKFVVSFGLLGDTLPSMLTAALAIHLLMTAMTGSEGDWKRHLAVLGLFGVLSLPLPLTQIPWVRTFHNDNMAGTRRTFCVVSHDSQDATGYFEIAVSTAKAFFPLAVLLGCGLAAALRHCSNSRKGNPKSEQNSSEFILTGLQGALILLCCLPICVLILVNQYGDGLWSQNRLHLFFALFFLGFSRIPLSSTIAAGWIYAFAYRRRRSLEGYIAPTSNGTADNERQKLVN